MIERIAENGVVGAGGAGFPTAVKLRASADTFLVNGAECEPLMHKDKELLLHYGREMLTGLAIGMECVGATRGIIGVKEKYASVIEALQAMVPSNVTLFPLRDTYPAGDEFILVYDVLGKIIPPGGLPLDVGAVVSNVETLVNIGLGRPVTHKFLTVAGAVAEPVTLRVPVGISFGELIEAAGGATVDSFGVLLNGAMMGREVTSLEEPVTKTTGGLIVLPEEHRLVDRYRKTYDEVSAIGRSACDQCSFCTELCPRYLIGHPIEPHKAMRALGFAPDKDAWIAGTLYCCECNLCSLYSCPEDLDPRDICAHSKPVARERDLGWKGNVEELRAHPVEDGRRVPIRRLMTKLGLDEFRNVGPLVERSLMPERVTLPVQQHLGAPCRPVVKVGDRVSVGDVIAAPQPDALGVNIHASIDGVVERVGDTIVLVADSLARGGERG